MLEFIMGASLTLNLALIYLAWSQDLQLEAAQEVIGSLVEPENPQNNDQ